MTLPSPTTHTRYYVAALLVLTGACGYLTYEVLAERAAFATLAAERAALQEAHASTTFAYLSTKAELANRTNELATLREELADLADDYHDELDRNEEFEDQIRELAGTLGDLEKLKTIDEELLAKYSKVYFLNENYLPTRLEQINARWVVEQADDEYFHADAMEHLEDLLRAADRAGLTLKITSAYRSFDEQADLKGDFMTVYGEGANTFSADQGYSEHQLGTAVDFTTPEIGSAQLSFVDTPEYEWLLENAYKYGFILSYPEGNEFYIFEPWHWRFVSRGLARELNRSGETFYTMEQREINEYLLNFFD